MITLLAPLGLAALAAIVVPLVIHWIGPSDQRLVSFAAMRYLREQHLSREKSHLHERWLLLLRILLIAALGLWLSLPVWRGHSEPQAPWILVASGVDAGAARNSIPEQVGEWRWLSPGFPSLNTARVPHSGEPLMSLVREADSVLTPGTAMIVVVPSYLDGLDAERLQLRRPVTWHLLPGAAPAAKSPVSPTPTLAVRYDPANASELPVAQALASAWTASGTVLPVDIATWDKPLPKLPAWLIWLGAAPPKSVNDWVREGGRLLISRQSTSKDPVVLADDNGTAVLRARVLGNGRLLSLTVPLKIQDLPALAAPDFAKTLATELQRPTLAPGRTPAASVAPLQLPTASRLWGRPQSLASYFAVLIALMFLFERLYATRIRVRDRAPSGASAGARS